MTFLNGYDDMTPSCSTLGLTGLTAPPGFPAFARASFPFSNANPRVFDRT